MESSFCLTKILANKFKLMLKSGEINVGKLADMSSSGRREFFTKGFGERNAKEINAIFESKLLLKNQQRGLVNWAKQITGIKPEAKKEMIDKIMRMDKILSPEDEKAFLSDLASKRLGTDITTEEAKKIVEYSNKIRSLENYKTEEERIQYGLSKLDLMEYVNSLNPKKANLVQNVLGIPRAILSSIDLSAPLNQGFGMISRKEFYKSFKDMFKYAASAKNLKTLQADIITRPTYRAAKKAGLRLTDLGTDLSKREENYMTNLLDKVPGIAGSQRAYTGFLTQLRMDVFDNMVKKAELAGEDVNVGSKALEDIAKSVNMFTGGSKSILGEGSASIANSMIFSPRKVTSALNILNPKTYLNPNTSLIARKESLRNAISMVAGSITMLGLMKLYYGDKVKIEADPRSSDFGKGVIGNTRVDVTGGMGAYITLIARGLTNSTKSTTTGGTYKLGAGYGVKDYKDVLSQFASNKLAPNMSLALELQSSKDFMGKEIKPTESILNRMKPMYLNSLWELLNDPKDGGGVELALLGLFGAGMNTYSNEEKKSSRKSDRSSSSSERKTTR